MVSPCGRARLLLALVLFGIAGLALVVLLRAAKPLLEQDGDDDDQLPWRRDCAELEQVVLGEDVGQRREDQDAEDGADDRAAAAGQQRAADDDRGDRVELVERAVRRGAGRRSAR